MGFARRQVSAVVLVQAFTLVVISLVIGVALGLVGGRWAWSLFADNLGLIAGPVLPWTGLLVLVAGLARPRRGRRRRARPTSRAGPTPPRRSGTNE